MKKISIIGSYLKKIYRGYSSELLLKLQAKGFLDLRPSFLEVLLYICENDATSIKMIGRSCGLKKQTMTSHLNELESRGYILRKIGQKDKREQNIVLTEYGEKFKVALMESIEELENSYVDIIGSVELDRIELMLKNFHEKLPSHNATV
ncbi:MAG: hypothetical protein A2504_15810 [Bdellovibrionales bacterium RIFOXYD12_FULL_39_22]|nr:MAG: hypothetical protein A2385_07720 [Bdellovibrionales bacterium RIFOXYB1_FULL_39_21]OFZ43053.1 MAG: hypothetical protein A2485_11505 [Bdellovibrionales bacterium RIFOXYC12_FULL_39_17]OFZ50861.1 MAG: hypothetical protein A2404_06635 [Bdellovibrionales bacterium RIFOXYC1_FULL_39_130]OFZ75516.1 MAG: hypothetical protein A2451_10600 [Bdellovibrionales bacterium RIFOXYC2_FULL_39_8]OFZ78084.1 MAG: hypothetical protein A2560_01805 [Bdellovibrionales bacterium RIFOXYD1_FULL_39_84]OFZ93952.1 MAG: